MPCEQSGKWYERQCKTDIHFTEAKLVIFLIKCNGAWWIHWPNPFFYVRAFWLIYCYYLMQERIDNYLSQLIMYWSSFGLLKFKKILRESKDWTQLKSIGTNGRWWSSSSHSFIFCLCKCANKLIRKTSLDYKGILDEDAIYCWMCKEYAVNIFNYFLFSTFQPDQSSLMFSVHRWNSKG